MYQVDAFTDQLFGGNPAAVCYLDEWLSDSVMQKIAAENNLSETAFFVRSSVQDEYAIRWFTPTIEIDLCGHATLATSHIIFTEISPESELIRFQSKVSGQLTVTRQKETGLYTLDFPCHPSEPIDLPDGLLSALRCETKPVGVYKAIYHLLVYPNEADVQQLTPDFSALSKFRDIFALIVTAPGDKVDFVSRVFAPTAGIFEDPVCGSAHCTLTPYWAERLGKNQLHAYQISARKGELWCEKRDDRVHISGKAVTYLKGEINV